MARSYIVVVALMAAAALLLVAGCSNAPEHTEMVRQGRGTSDRALDVLRASSHLFDAGFLDWEGLIGSSGEDLPDEVLGGVRTSPNLQDYYPLPQPGDHADNSRFRLSRARLLPDAVTRKTQRVSRMAASRSPRSWSYVSPQTGARWKADLTGQRDTYTLQVEGSGPQRTDAALLANATVRQGLLAANFAANLGTNPGDGLARVTRTITGSADATMPGAMRGNANLAYHAEQTVAGRRVHEADMRVALRFNMPDLERARVTRALDEEVSLEMLAELTLLYIWALESADVHVTAFLAAPDGYWVRTAIDISYHRGQPLVASFRATASDGMVARLGADGTGDVRDAAGRAVARLRVADTYRLDTLAVDFVDPTVPDTEVGADTMGALLALAGL